MFWGGGGAIFKIALQFGAMVTLARLLGPEQFGLFAIGTIVVGFSGFFSDFGIAYGLIQKEEVTHQDLRFVATWQLLTGLIVTVAVISTSALLASLLGDARAQQVIEALALVCLLNALAAPSLNLLKRALDFKSIQLAQVSGYFVGFVLVGVPLALADARVWALVAAWLTQALVTLVVLFARSPHPVRPLLWFKGAGAMLHYGGIVLITNLVNWMIGNIDRVMVARFFSSRDVGLYSSAYNMLYNPTASLLGVIQPVFFSASVRVAEDSSKRMVDAYLVLLACIATFVLPLFAGLAAVAPTFILALYGPAWHEAGALLTPMALAMPLFLAWGLTTPLVWAGGKPGREWKVQLPLAMLWVGAAWLASSTSPVAVAWTILVLGSIRFVAMLVAAMRMLDLRLHQILQAVRGGLLLSIACAALMASIDHFLRQWAGGSALTRLAADVLAGGATLGLSLRLVPALVNPETAAFLSKVSTRLPAPLAAILTVVVPRCRS